MKIKNKKFNKWFISNIKYIITLVTFAVIIIFLDQNSLIKRYKNSREISLMREEIARNKMQCEQNGRYLYRLQTDPHFLEELARKNYFMKKPNEDIFVFETEETE